MQVALSMALALLMILFGAELFTNGVEWLGVKMRLGQSAVGSVLAAIGTALPETAVPVTAILFGRGSSSSHEVGIGGILGAPFLLVTLGSLIVAVSVLLFRQRPSTVGKLRVHPRAFSRDMSFFLVAYGFSMVVGCISWDPLHEVAPWVLAGLYGAFVIFSLRDKSSNEHVGNLHPLYLQWKSDTPSTAAVLLQLVVALLAIVGGAHLLSNGVQHLAFWLGIPPFVLSALLIPLATELPETLNSVVWLRQGKDALALGNITGAMVFQSTLVPALGILLTPWQLTPQAMLTGGLTMAAGAMVYGLYKLRGELLPRVLVAASFLYWVLPLHAIAARYGLTTAYWAGWCAAGFALLISVQSGLRMRSV